MQKLVTCGALAAPLILAPACLSPSNLPPSHQAQVEQLDQEIAEAEAAGNSEVAAELREEQSSVIRSGLEESYGWVSGGLTAAGVPPFLANFWPGLAMLFFKRPRKHLVAAAKSAVPTKDDPTFDVLGALQSVLKAGGLLHSSKDSEAVS